MVDADDADLNAYTALRGDRNYKFVTAQQLISSFILVNVSTISTVDYPNTTHVTLFCNHHSFNAPSFDELVPVTIDGTTYHECELRTPFNTVVKPQNLDDFGILSAAEHALFIVHYEMMKSMLYFFSDGVPVDNNDDDNESLAAIKAAQLIQEQFNERDHAEVNRMVASFFTDAITRGRKQYVKRVLPIAKKFWDSAGRDPKLKNTTACLLELLQCNFAYPLSCSDRNNVYIPLYRVASFNPSAGDKFTTGNGLDAMAGIRHNNKDHVILNLSVRIDVVHEGKRFSILLALDNPTLLRNNQTLMGIGNVYYFIGEVMQMMFDPFFYNYLNLLLQGNPSIVSWLNSFLGVVDIPNNLVVRVLDFNCKVPQHIVKRADTVQNGFILTNQFSLPHVDHNGIRRLFYRSNDRTIWVLKIRPYQHRLLNTMRTDSTSSESTVLRVPTNYIDMDLPTDEKHQDDFLQSMVGSSFSSMNFSMEEHPTQLTLTQVINEESDPHFKLDVNDVPSQLGFLPTLGVPAAAAAAAAAAVGNPGITSQFVSNALNEVEKNTHSTNSTWRNSFVSTFQGAVSKVYPFLSSALSMASSLISRRMGGCALRRSLNKSKKKRIRTVRMYRRGLSYRKMTRRTRGKRRMNTRRNRKN